MAKNYTRNLIEIKMMKSQIVALLAAAAAGMEIEGPVHPGFYHAHDTTSTDTTADAFTSTGHSHYGHTSTPHAD